MKVFIITYELKKQGKDYTSLFNEIKTFSGWWHYIKNTWLIVSSDSPAVIFERLKNHIDESDRILIIEVKNNCEGWLDQKAWEWIKKNVPI